MKRFGWGSKEHGKESEAEPTEVAGVSDDPSNRSTRDTVPQLPNIARNSIALGRNSVGERPSLQHNSAGDTGHTNGNAVPVLAKVTLYSPP